jgi:hypothetical protein
MDADLHAICEINGTELFYVQVGQGLPCLVMHGGRGFDLRPWLDRYTMNCSSSIMITAGTANWADRP